jgi:membrane protease YdiL (CAAX protease family)
MGRKWIIGAIFAAFFVSGYLFILLNSLALYYLSIAAGLLSIPSALILYRGEIVDDFRSSVMQLSILISSFIILLFFFLITDPRWGVLIPSIFIAPVLIEEFNFRYLLQRIIFRGASPYAAVILQSLFYVLYYSKYVVAGGGIGYPFPYNLLMMTSILGMGLLYGLLSKVTRNFLLPTTLHLVIWSLFPILALYPWIASTLFPT